MKVIVSHTNLDFDGLASMIGASKLYPQAIMILPEKLSPGVANFLAIYKDTFPFQRKNSINWEYVSEVVMVDVNSLHRIDVIDLLPENVSFIVYDHHPITDKSVTFHNGEVTSAGATMSILATHLQAVSVTISPFEATVFALGIYSDTGAFTYEQTTSRDFLAAAYFFENGANLAVIQQFRELPLSLKEDELFQLLLVQSTVHSIDDTNIFVCWHKQNEYTGHLSHITRKILERTGADAVFSIVKMSNKVFVTARSSSNRVDVLPIITELGGGGHKKAASAMKKEVSLETVLQQVLEKLSTIVLPPITAKDLMSSPVRVVAPDTAIEDVSKMLYRYGHTGFPVMENDTLVGIISRRDVDKALHHQLGHAPVKGFMSRHPLTINENISLEQIQEYMIEYQIGRLPVTGPNGIVGIVSRTDVIEALHGRKGKTFKNMDSSHSLQSMDFKSQLREQLPDNYYFILQLIGEEANNQGIKAYLIGGMVRDLFLKRTNVDMDIVIEGDAIDFANGLKDSFGGRVKSHQEFGTATWKHPSQAKVDLTSARTEYYDFPAALPKVEKSTIKEDLLRRDFTINAMAICLHKNEFGQLIDYFHGYEDLKKKKIRILYNLSFVEDPTRILRAIRFESRFQFLMDKHTESLAIQSGSNLLELSKPRIASELKKLFTEEDPLYALKRFSELNLLDCMLKDLPIREGKQLEITQMLNAINKLKQCGINISASHWIGYLLLLTSPADNEIAKLVGYTLNKDEQKLLDSGYTLLKSSAFDENHNTIGDWHRSFYSYSVEELVVYISTFKDDMYNKGINYLISREKMQKKIDGNILKNYGLRPGAEFKDILLEGEIVQLNHPNWSKEMIIKQILK